MKGSLFGGLGAGGSLGRIGRSVYGVGLPDIGVSRRSKEEMSLISGMAELGYGGDGTTWVGQDLWKKQFEARPRIGFHVEGGGLYDVT